MMTEIELNEIDKRNPANAGVDYEDAHRLVEELRWMRTMMRSISGMELLLRPGMDMREFHSRLEQAIATARIALGLPKNGEPTVLAQTSGSPANQAAQVPPRMREPGRPGPKPAETPKARLRPESPA